MRHSVKTHHDDEVACRGHAAAGATPVCGDHGLFAAGLGSSWTFAEDVSGMDRSIAVRTYGCYDPPPTPATFQSPPSLMPPGMYHATPAGVGELHYYPSSHQNNVEATPPYFIGDRRLPPEVLDHTTSGVYGGMSMQYRDAKLALTAGGVSGSGFRSSPDDRDCSMRAVLLAGAGDALMRTPANLTPPPSMFSWRGGQSSGSSSTADHEPVSSYATYYTNTIVDQPSCHSPVGADRESVVFVYIYFGVTMPPKIFVGDVRCLATPPPPNECPRALYGRFRPLPSSCLLAQCDSSYLLHFRFAVRSHCRVIFL